MKPEDLLNAMNGIPEDYISEAKPNEKRRGESRSMKQNAASVPPEQAANGHSSRIRKHGGGNRRKDSIMSTKQPVWQRVTTGIAAAAACTVFIGGGLFIVQQTKQNQPDTAANGYTNFLGGKGEIHVAADSCYPLRGMTLMYDDTKVYFYGGLYAADRTGDTVSKAYPTSASVRETVSHTLWDGEQFYYQNGLNLYTMDMTGDWGAGEPQLEPFYHINRHYIGLDDPEAEVKVTNVQKLRENDYVISLLTTGRTAEGYEAAAASNILHHPQGYRIEDDNQAEPPEPAPGLPGEIMLEQNDLAVAQLGINGRFLAWNPDLPFDLNSDDVTVMDPEQMFSDTQNCRLIGDSEIVQPAEYGKAWMVNGNKIYYLTEIVSTNVIYEGSHYAALDAYTGDFTDMGEAVFESFIPCGGDILYVTKDGKTLCSNDYALANEQLLYTYDDNVPAEIQAAVSDKWDAKPLCCFDAADASYAMITMDCREEGSAVCALYDRTAGQMRYFTLSEEAAPEQEENRNFLGGTGDLSPCDDTQFMYDETKIYFNNGAQCAVRFGGEFTKLMNTEDVQDMSAFSDYHVQAVQALQPEYAGQLYARKGYSIYHADTMGHIDDVPFYTVSDKDIAKLNNHLGEGWELEHYIVTRLNDEMFVVDLYAVDKDKKISTALSYLFRPFSDEQTAMPECICGTYLADGKFCCAVSKNGDLYTINTETGKQQKTNLTSHPINVSGGMILEDGYLYYMSSIGGNGESYMRLDLKTHEYTALLDVSEYGVKECMAYDGMNYWLSADGSRIECFAPSKPETRTCLYDYEKDAPERAKESVQTARKKDSRIKFNIRCILSVSDAYLTAELADGQIMLLDRKTGAVRYFSEQYAETPEAAHTQPAPQNPDTTDFDTPAQYYNAFGGNGEIVPVYQNDAGKCGLFRDDAYYYNLPESAGEWERRPLDGSGGWERIPQQPLDGDKFFTPPTGALLTDGERVYNENLDIVYGDMAEDWQPFADLDGLFKERNNEKMIWDRDMTQVALTPRYIWHIRDGYFLLVDYIDRSKNERGYWRLMLDENGKPLSGTSIGEDLYEDNGTIDSWFCDAEHEHMYYIAKSSVQALPTAHSDGTPYQPPKTDKQITSACISGGKTVFVTAEGDLMLADEDGNVLAEPIDRNVVPYQAPELLPNGMLTYYRTTGGHKHLCIMPRFAQGDYGPFLWKSPAENPYLCGWTADNEIVIGDEDTAEFYILRYDAEKGDITIGGKTVKESLTAIPAGAGNE